MAVDEVQIEDLMEREEISIDMEKISGGIKGKVVDVYKRQVELPERVF